MFQIIFQLIYVNIALSEESILKNELFKYFRGFDLGWPKHCYLLPFDIKVQRVYNLSNHLFGVTWFNNAHSPLAKVKLIVCISEMISFRNGTRISVNLTQWVRRITLIDSVCLC